MVLARGALALMVLAACAWPAGAASAQTKRVLLLTDSARAPGETIVTDRFDARLRGELEGVELFTEALDANRFPEPEHQTVFADYLQAKFANLPPDLVVALGPSSVAFFAATRLFPGAPLVVAGVPASSLPADGSLPNATGVLSRFDVVETLELALRLQPNARELVVVSGSAPLDVLSNEFARADLEPYRDRLVISYLANMTTAQVAAGLSRLSRDTIVLFLTMRRDSAGEYLVDKPDYITRFPAVSAAPMYTLYQNGLGTGMVGGHVESLAAMGDTAAGLALRILSGERAADVPPVQATNIYAVDWRQLHRWNLDEGRLPPDTVVMFRDPSLWTQYRGEILGTLSILALQTLFIVALLLYIRKRRVEKTLLETEDRYRNIVESQIDLICRYRPDTTLTFVNDAYCRYFGRPREALVGRQFVGLIPEAERAKALDHVRSLTSQPRTESYVHQAAKHDGSLRWQQWTDHPIIDEHGKVVEIQGIGRDITELKAAETEALQRREQVTHLTRVAVLGELSGAIAHELNQPMTAILSNAEAAEMLLEQDSPNLSELRAILGDIVSDDKRAGEVIRRLRTMTKPGSAAYQSIDLTVLLGEVLALVHPQLVERNVKVIQRIATPVPRVYGDHIQLQQVLLNLFINAGDAMAGNDPTDRALVVDVAQRDGLLCVAVGDNGTGLAPHVAERVFEPFVTTKADGLGLGLSICRSIIGLHGGRLSVRNNPDRGATFEFTLPVASA